MLYFVSENVFSRTPNIISVLSASGETISHIVRPCLELCTYCEYLSKESYYCSQYIFLLKTMFLLNILIDVLIQHVYTIIFYSVLY